MPETLRDDSMSFNESLAHDPRWQTVQQVLASRTFSRSSRLSAFLIYVCGRALEDRSDEISEQQIGIHVFDRPATYNPGDDNIVRTTARQLRQRLALYYQEEGTADEFRVDIPRGAYHPQFLPRRVETVPGPPEPLWQIEQKAHLEPPLQLEPAAAPIIATRMPRALSSLLWLAVASGLLAGCVVTLAVLRLAEAHRAYREPGGQIWSTLLTNGKPTLFVAGDAGLNMYDNLARTQVTLGDYVSGHYLNTVEAKPPVGYTWAALAGRRYVSFVDSQLAVRLQELAGAHHAPYTVRFARDVTANDLRDRNLILTGSAMYNPWIALFDSRLSFHLDYDGVRNEVSVVNRKPEAGEPARYLAERDDSRGMSHGFAYIALCDNLEKNGKVLMIEGSTVAGVDAAISFLTNESKMAPILNEAIRRQGRLDHFELLLGADFLKSSSPDGKLLATRL